MSRGWCSPASLAMIHAFFGIDQSGERNGARRLRPRVQRDRQLGVQRRAIADGSGCAASSRTFRNLDHAQRLDRAQRSARDILLVE